MSLNPFGRSSPSIDGWSVPPSIIYGTLQAPEYILEPNRKPTGK